jgi:uncharacterized repeat protein (TIGR03806 family)
MRLLLSVLAICSVTVGLSAARPAISGATIAVTANPATLSAFGFFEGTADRLSSQLIAYSLRTPLFSDYAEKQRFIYLPDGEWPAAGPNGRLIFPVGTALIKSFGYPSEAGSLKILETRVLLHRPDGWVALPYVWRADGSDADLRVGGTRIPVQFAHGANRMSINYGVPNKNQCKQCHSSDGNIMPIGPVWQNMEFSKAADRDKLLRAMPTLAAMKPSAKWNDPASGLLNERAHSYLRVNCGHCHAPKGSASNSGLFLDGSAKDPAAYGIGKRPVAAGRASGDLDFIIEQGKPERSILINRMKSIDPGIAMPELGRATAHSEGVALLEEWIAAMPTNGAY